MQNHYDRMDDFFRKVPSKKRMDREVGQVPRKQRRYIHKKTKVTHRRLKTIMKSGAGFPMDQLLRYYLREFNGRLKDHGPEFLPPDFNVMEAFFLYDAEDIAFYLIPEKDHIISSVDFIDFITSPDAPDDVYNEIFHVKDNLIHSFNMYDDPHDLTFSTGENKRYGFKGLSFSKRGDDVSVMLLCGQVADFSAINLDDFNLKYGDSMRPELKDRVLK
jgi:hypothetical protein